MKILITGSRDWQNEEIIFQAIKDETDSARVREIAEPHFIIIHGDCPTGADRFAEAIAHAQGYEVQAYPADWEKYGRRAGMIRNKEMLDLEPDIVLGFPLKQSKGTIGCLNEAMRRQIPIKVFYEQ